MKHFRPRAGRHGTLPQHLTTPVIGGAAGAVVGGASPVTANATTILHRFSITTPCMFAGFSATVATVPADADGTILYRVRKYDGRANAYVTLSQDIDGEAAITLESQVAGPLPGVTTAQLMLLPGDSLEVIVVNNSAALNTQPAGLVFDVEVFQVE